ACLEVLNWRLQDRPEALDLVQRVKKAQADLNRLFEDVRGYAVPLHLLLEECDLAAVWREAWSDLAPLRAGRGAELREEVGDPDLRCVASPFNLRQVFRNLPDTALTAVTGPARLVIACASAEIDDRPAVRIVIRDNGPGFTPEQRQRAFE